MLLDIQSQDVEFRLPINIGTNDESLYNTAVNRLIDILHKSTEQTRKDLAQWLFDTNKEPIMVLAPWVYVMDPLFRESRTQEPDFFYLIDALSKKLPPSKQEIIDYWKALRNKKNANFIINENMEKAQKSIDTALGDLERLAKNGFSEAGATLLEFYLSNNLTPELLKLYNTLLRDLSVFDKTTVFPKLVFLILQSSESPPTSVDDGFISPLLSKLSLSGYVDAVVMQLLLWFPPQKISQYWEGLSTKSELLDPKAVELLRNHQYSLSSSILVLWHFYQTIHNGVAADQLINEAMRNNEIETLYAMTVLDHHAMVVSAPPAHWLMAKTKHNAQKLWRWAQTPVFQYFYTHFSKYLESYYLPEKAHTMAIDMLKQSQAIPSKGFWLKEHYRALVKIMVKHGKIEEAQNHATEFIHLEKGNIKEAKKRLFLKLSGWFSII